MKFQNSNGDEKFIHANRHELVPNAIDKGTSIVLALKNQYTYNVPSGSNAGFTQRGAKRRVYGSMHGWDGTESKIVTNILMGFKI